MSEPSIYELFDKVKQHPDFVFGTIFTRDDFAFIKDTHDVDLINTEAATSHITSEGFEFVQMTTDPPAAA